MLKQPGNVDYAYSIFDSDWREQMLAGMPYSGGMFNDNALSVYGRPFTGDVEAGFIEHGLDIGTMFRADTIEELATLIHIAPEKLRATVDRYNAFVERKGRYRLRETAGAAFPDQKNRPFYASKFGPAMLAVVGGLLTDTRLPRIGRGTGPDPRSLRYRKCGRRPLRGGLPDDHPGQQPRPRRHMGLSRCQKRPWRTDVS